MIRQMLPKDVNLTKHVGVVFTFCDESPLPPKEAEEWLQ